MKATLGSDKNTLLGAGAGRNSVCIQSVTFVTFVGQPLSKQLFTITAQILASSLANFYRQKADRHVNLKINVSFSYVCPVIDNEFRHNIVKATLTML